MGSFQNLSGQKFGRLTAIKVVDKTTRFESIWLCKCDCGNLTKVPCTRLKSGKTKSCGCYNIERLKNRSNCHGKTKTRVFYKPFFILDEFFSTETKDFDDYAQERNDAVFAGFLGETMVDMAKYEESRRKNDFDYSKESRRYRNKVEYPKDKEYYNDMLDNIAGNADMGDVETQGEEKPNQ